MKILYYDCFSGISGDMNLGALLDLGVSRETLISGLQKLNTGGWRLEITRDQRHGITGTKVTVVTGDNQDQGHSSGHDRNHSHEDEYSHEHDHNHDHEHEHNHEHDHHHGHDYGHTSSLNPDEGHHHENRNLADIEKIITGSGLAPEVKELAMKIFRKIAEAEAAVHDKPIDEIHFHEVGAIDSIVDIVGAAICLNEIGADRIYVSEIELGSGMVKCQHGLLPVPAPATARIIRGFPVHTGGVGFEATTPTGAAIIASVAEPLPPSVNFVILKSGYGIGHKNNPGRPNLLRVYLAETESEPEKGHEAKLVECNVDDMNPEMTEYISGRLFAAGAGDVWFTPVIMKKGRPAFTLSVICEAEQLDAVREIIFTESTTIGLRVSSFTKETLHREFEELDTRFGKVTIKKSYYNGRLVSVKPEAARCAAIAAATGLPMKEVMQEINSQIREKS
jgi:uncharacterized protein (TIGR00299 family) protein